MGSPVSPVRLRFRCAQATPDTLRPDGLRVACQAVARGHKPAFACRLRRGSLHSLRERRLVRAVGLRTHTTLPSRDFKSLASTSSATSAYVHEIRYLARFPAKWNWDSAPGPKRVPSLSECARQSKASIPTPAAALGNLNIVRLRRSDDRFARAIASHSRAASRALALLALGARPSGCAGMSDTMSPAFADPAKYDLYDCKQLETERKTLADAQPPNCRG